MSLICCLFAQLSCLSQNTIPLGKQPSISQKIDSIITQKMQTYTIPGLAIGIVQQDDIVYTQGYGKTSIYNGNTVTKNTIFHTASISKLFTAQGIMQLIKTYKLSLDEYIVNIIPEVSSKDKRFSKITLRNLLNHTSGLPDIKNYHWDKAHRARNSLQNYIQNQNFKLRSTPGTEYYYSNLGYNLLGYIIEKVSQQSFEDYMQSQLLKPLDMLPSDFRYEAIPEALRTRPHSKSKFTGKVYIQKTYPYTREHAASSTLNASVSALSNWMCDFLYALDTKETSIYVPMITPSIPGKEHIGLGFQLYAVYDYKGIGHFGGDKGFRSFLLMIPNQHIGIVLLANCDYNEDFRQEIAFAITKLLLEGN